MPIAVGAVACREQEHKAALLLCPPSWISKAAHRTASAPLYPPGMSCRPGEDGSSCANAVRRGAQPDAENSVEEDEGKAQKDSTFCHPLTSQNALLKC